MKIYFNKLSKYQIDKLVFNSLEQALYQPIVVIDGEEYVVWESSKKTMLSHNLTVLRERFSTLDIPQVCLRHESPYDEMVGQASKDHSNRLEVPLRALKTELPEKLN